MRAFSLKSQQFQNDGMDGWKIDGHEGVEIERFKQRKKVVGTQDFKESRSQQERDVGGEDFKVSMRALSVQDNQKGER